MSQVEEEVTEVGTNLTEAMAVEEVTVEEDEEEDLAVQGNSDLRQVKVGEEFEVKIESMSKRGDAGVAKVEGLVIFVAGTKIGDSVRIRVTKVGRGYATAEIAEKSASAPPEEDKTEAAAPTDESTCCPRRYA